MISLKLSAKFTMLLSKTKAKPLLSLPSSLQEVMIICVLRNSPNSVVLGDYPA